MLELALIFFAITIVTALLGFGGVVGAASTAAQLLFFIFLIVLVRSLVMSLISLAK